MMHKPPTSSPSSAPARLITRVHQIGAIAALSMIAAGCAHTRLPEAPAGPSVRVMTYNVNWGGPQPDLAVGAITRADAEIVCLQETNPAWVRYLRAHLAEQYPFMAFRDTPGRTGGGLAYLAKQTGEQVAYVPSVTGWFDGWIMTFPTPVGPIQAANVHLQPPASDAGHFTVSAYRAVGGRHQREIERLYHKLKPGLPTLILGDFNEDDSGDAIRWLEHKGMTNALPEFDRGTNTWRWHTSLITLRKRLDHIIYSPELHCYSAEVLRAGASDHLPVVGVFGIEGEAKAEK